MGNSADTPMAPTSDRPRRTLAERVSTRLAHWGFLAARPMTLGVRGVALDPERGVLLVKHTYVAGWHFPGGGVEPGETFAQSLERELIEEAKIEIVGTPELHGLFFNINVSRRDHVAVYVIRNFRVLGERAPDNEILAATFFPLDALPPDTSRATRARLAEIVEGRPLSPHW